MNLLLENKSPQVRDVWIGCLIFLLFYFFSPFFLYSFFKNIFPELSSTITWLIIIVISHIIPLIYFSYKYGLIDFSDLVPHSTDIFVLFGSIVLIFIFVSLGVLKGGWQSGVSHQILTLKGMQRPFGFLIAIFIGPLLEETFLRRYVLEILKYKYPIVVAVFITVTLETAFHIGYLKDGIRPLIHIFIFSLLFTFIYLMSRLGISVMAHSLLNGYLILLAKNV